MLTTIDIMVIIVFDSEIGGHHLEYIHHLYDAAIIDSQNKYIFIINRHLESVKNKLIWDKANNVTIISLNNKQQKQCDNKNLILAALYKSLLVKKYIKKFNADQIWLIMFMQLMPFLPYLIKDNIQVKGILYRIYLYEKERMSKFRLLLERIRYRLIIHNKSIKKILVLNDSYGTNVLNNEFQTDKFKYIPDPVPFIDNKKLKNIRCNLNIRNDEIVYLHFGGLCYRKGTLDIMHAIDIMDVTELHGKVFIFAGKISNDIKETFYYLKSKNDLKCRILVYDEFCDYDFINNLCYSCNCILLPYYNTNQSSGIIGYAGYFNKPVIAPSAGILGKLVREYKLGICFNQSNISYLIDAILNPILEIQSDYYQSHKIMDFVAAWK